jgi:hypothetical protein
VRGDVYGKPLHGIKSADDCPDAARRHTPSPTGYIAWHEWAEKKARTHVQRRCPSCGFLAVWVRK